MKDTRRGLATERSGLLSNLTMFSGLYNSEEERRLILKRPGVGGAAFLIRDVVIGLAENPADGAYDPYRNSEEKYLNTISVICRRICSRRSVQQFVTVIILTLVLLTFVEPPAWCRYLVREGEVFDMEHISKEGRCEELMEASGPAIGSNETEIVEYYPNWHAIFLKTDQQAQIIELVCLICLWAYFFLRVGRDGMSMRRYFRPGAARKTRIAEFTAVTYLSIGVIVEMAMDINLHRPLKPYMRLLLFVSTNQNCLLEMKTMLRMVG